MFLNIPGMRSSTVVVVLLFFMLVMITSCGNNGKENSADEKGDYEIGKAVNPVVYFEIPVTDCDRAKTFYKSVFGFEFEREIIDNNEMALFPFVTNGSGISGALAKGEIYKPTREGTLIYFATMNLDSTLNLVLRSGGKILYPKTSNGDLGFVAEFEDSEGNRIALHMSKE